jgi:hypothetical protein
MARAQDEWVVKKIPGSGVACGVVPYGATAVLRSALVLKGALQLLKYQLAYSFVLLGVFMSEKNMSSSRKFCVNDPNNFCYICGKYCQQLQRRNITDFVKQAYEEY